MMPSTFPLSRRHARRGLAPLVLIALVAGPLAGQQPATGATNPRLLPDISVVGDLIADFSPPRRRRRTARASACARSSSRSRRRSIRTSAATSSSDSATPRASPSSRRYLTATALPWQLEVRLGRFLMPFGKQNTTHRHDLHTIDYPVRHPALPRARKGSRAPASTLARSLRAVRLLPGIHRHGGGPPGRSEKGSSPRSRSTRTWPGSATRRGSGTTGISRSNANLEVSVERSTGRTGAAAATSRTTSTR